MKPLTHFIPFEVKRKIKILLRSFHDTRKGRSKKWAKKSQKRASEKAQHVIEQKIIHADTNLAKIHNLQKGAATISEILILPNQIFSFWRVVGAPTEKHGFKKSRNLVGGKLQQDFGGGVCQLSGIIYALSLAAKLKIEERYPHSVDIYTEEERFAPLGLDATVVFCFKDLRGVNNLSQPIRFILTVEGEILRGAIFAENTIETTKIICERTDFDKHISVKTFFDEQQKTPIAFDTYFRLKKEKIER